MFAKLLHLSASNHLFLRIGYAKLACDCKCSLRVISRNHNNINSSLFASLDCLFDIRPQWVCKCNNAKKREFGLYRFKIKSLIYTFRNQAFSYYKGTIPIFHQGVKFPI